MASDELERRAFNKWFQPRLEAMKSQGVELIGIKRLKQRQWEAWQASARQERNDG